MLSLVFISAPLTGGAQVINPDTNLCRETGIEFAFLNGVQTTKLQAAQALGVLIGIHGQSAPGGDQIKYETLYNYSNGFEDFVETFEQRLQEQDGLLAGRLELFFEALNGGGSWWDNITNSVPAAAELLNGFNDWRNAATIRYLTAMLGNPPTLANYMEHQSRIDNWILEGKKILLVAHSQGNLFANAAYAYAAPKAAVGSVKVVHIAPASPTLNGEHTLADKDLVINGLRAVGTVADITDSIPAYQQRPAGINGGKDLLGHGLLEIYINPGLEISNRVKSHITTALSTLVAPPARATSGFFTTTLTWDGSGDVDLHTYEPGGSHVYYRYMRGASGYLDVDNTVAYGPEHYYASCDSARLQEGTYRVAIANYARAAGRVATVQVASWDDGVLGTKSVTLGAATGDNPVYAMFNVVVSKNAQNGKYSATLAP
ncbi:hypothetical protein [Comamonas sp. Tr-654]|uniref:hypothetical protein n=1 Tax=Comamonas sp. Tr-654 TaxID=2608341 RepID=UPI001F04FF6F|nr:hypothetical protein [Comamonas sp. Tr-654]